ncbi:hypothetical protein BAE44_0002851 [Dichanthelium oligosanthes]|uniref:Uncharacterized protein n=1 Tax=Dichanthelium oligosanthes TaxID=888268 RepID=A0A1E5WG48_9POAL|nr:hypothetical protein BAE44_0002851 [Dichanthelium oligosanthes]
MAELAMGLEASGHRFLWVVRFPSDKDRSASYFGESHGHGNSPIGYLPEGFVERTRDTALLVQEWIPQVGLALWRRASSKGKDGVAPREVAAAAVTELIVGEKGAAAREKACELREEAEKAWAPDGSRTRPSPVSGRKLHPHELMHTIAESFISMVYAR